MSGLRPYQVEGVERVRAEIRGGKRRVLFVLATGGGKTVVAAAVIRAAVARGRRVLFVAHRRELVNQAYAKLLAAGVPEADVGVLMADDRRRRPGAPVQVASVDTLRHRAAPPADLVIVDEAHRALSKSYRDLLATYPAAVHLGLTATPYRADGQGLGAVYEALVVIATPRLLIAAGFLAAPRVFTVPASRRPDLSGVRVKGGDYDADQLAAAMNREGLVGDIVAHWQRLAADARTVVFAASVAHSQAIVARFVAAGIAAEHLDGTTKTAERDAILGRLERGETRVVANCGVLCEGWDQPAVKCCVLARPTKSTGLYLQQAGRILRPWEGVRPLILDHAGCALEHGLPQDEREFSLEGRDKRGKGGANACPTKTCDGCCAVVAAAEATCPECGWVFPAKDRNLAERDGELVDATVRLAVAGELKLCEELRKKIARLTWRLDHERGWTVGETNKRLFRVFKKSRTKMTSTELRAVREHIEGGAFARANPVPVQAAPLSTVEAYKLEQKKRIAAQHENDRLAEVARREQIAREREAERRARVAREREAERRARVAHPPFDATRVTPPPAPVATAAPENEVFEWVV